MNFTTFTDNVMANPSKILQALKVAGIGMWELDTETGDSLWSEETFRLFGFEWTDEPIPMDRLLQTIHLDDRDLVRQTVERAKSQPIDVEYRIQRSDGRVIFVRAQAALDGQSRHILGIIQDISDQKQYQQELMESQKLYHLITSHSQDIISYSVDGVFQYISPSVKQLLGYHPSELIGQTSASLYHADDYDYLQKTAQRITQGEDVERFTCRVRTKQGNYLWYETTLSISRDEEGKVHQVVGVGRDVSDRIELQESLEHAIHLAGLGHWDANLADNTITYSTEMSRILKRNERDSIAPIQQFIDAVHPEDREILNLSAKKALDMGSSFDRVFRIIRKDGSVRFLHSQAEVILNDSGQPVRMIGTAQDVTKFKVLEQQLRDATAHFQTLVDNSPDAIGIFEQNQCIFMNSSGLSMFAATEETMDGLSLNELLHSSDEAKLSQIHSTLRFESRLQRQDGTWFDGEVVMIPCGLSTVQVIIRDVTDRKRDEVSLRNAEKLAVVGQLAASIAHEIRNPLTSIIGFTQIMRSKARGDNKRYFDIMRMELIRIEGILNQLLVLSKPQGEVFRPTDVGLVIIETATLLQAQATLQRVVIETQVDDGIPFIYADANQLKQVFVNVVKNAIESMPQGGVVRLSVAMVEEQVCVKCSDSGKGIPQDQLDKLGTPFYTTKENGTGLGFMVSQRIIDAHQGTMHVVSKVGVGTTVRIMLPTEMQVVQDTSN